MLDASFTHPVSSIARPMPIALARLSARAHLLTLHYAHSSARATRVVAPSNGFKLSGVCTHCATASPAHALLAAKSPPLASLQRTPAHSTSQPLTFRVRPARRSASPSCWKRSSTRTTSRPKTKSSSMPSSCRWTWRTTRICSGLHAKGSRFVLLGAAV